VRYFLSKGIGHPSPINTEKGIFFMRKSAIIFLLFFMITTSTTIEAKSEEYIMVEKLD
jgi:hypothetical protein